jgi:hypothetical protein
MFGIMGTDLIIDATHAGNAARFINHSCQVCSVCVCVWLLCARYCFA